MRMRVTCIPLGARLSRNVYRWANQTTIRLLQSASVVGMQPEKRAAALRAAHDAEDSSADTLFATRRTGSFPAAHPRQRPLLRMRPMTSWARSASLNFSARFECGGSTLH